MTRRIKLENNIIHKEIEAGDIVVCRGGSSYIVDEEKSLLRLKDGVITCVDEYELEDYTLVGKIKEIICE